jgi:hypothetical protein
MTREEMTCATCVFAAVDEKDMLRCVEKVPNDAWHMESLEDFPQVEPFLFCGQGAWRASVSIPEEGVSFNELVYWGDWEDSDA